MLRRPQRTEAAQRLDARTARTFKAPLRAGVSKTVAPRAAGGSRLRLKREHGAYHCRCLRSRSTARELATARRVRRSDARGVRAAPVSCLSPRPPAAALHAVTGGRSRQLPEGG